MLPRFLREFIKGALKRAGFDVITNRLPPATRYRPVGNGQTFFEDVRVRGFSPRWVFDVGAHHGDWSRTVHAVFPDARFVLVEPVRALIPELESLAREITGSHVVNAGAGSQAGELELEQLTTLDGQVSSSSSFLARATDGASKQMVRVPVVTLDSLVDSASDGGIPDLVKIDVEGYEPEVLKGARRLFGKTEMFVLEISFFSFWGQPILHEMLQLMAGYGYVAYDFVSFNRRPIDGALGLVDIVFVRTASALRTNSRYD